MGENDGIKPEETEKEISIVEQPSDDRHVKRLGDSSSPASPWH